MVTTSGVKVEIPVSFCPQPDKPFSLDALPASNLKTLKPLRNPS